MNGLNQVNVGSVLQAWINSIDIHCQHGFSLDKVVFAHNIMVNTQERCENRKLGSQFPKDTIYLPTFGVFKRKYFIVKSDRLFRFDKGSFPTVAFAMQDTLNLPFMLGKYSHYATSVQERFLSFGNESGFVEFSDDPA